MLRACRRVLRPGGRLAFYTIFVPAGLSPEAYERALIVGPPEVDQRHDHQTLLASAGFVDGTEADVTDQFLEVARRWFEARKRHAADLRLALGDSEFLRGRTESQATIAAIEAGLLRRSLFVARRP